MPTAPTGKFYEIPMTTAATALDTSAERLAFIGDGEVKEGSGYELDFGTVDISGGAADSSLRAVLFRITDWGDATSITNFRHWVTHGFDQATTKVKWVHCALDPTSEWVQNGVKASYTAAPNGGWADLPESVPASANVSGADGSASTITSTSPDSLEALVYYIAVAAGETAGEYKGTGDSGLQFSLKVDYA